MNNLVPQKFRKKSRITESIQKPLWVSASVSFQRVDRVGRNNSSTFQKNISMYLHDAHLLGTYCVKKKKKKKLCDLPPVKYEGKGERAGK